MFGIARQVHTCVPAPLATGRATAGSTDADFVAAAGNAAFSTMRLAAVEIEAGLFAAREASVAVRLTSSCRANLVGVANSAAGAAVLPVGEQVRAASVAGTGAPRAVASAAAADLASVATSTTGATMVRIAREICTDAVAVLRAGAANAVPSRATPLGATALGTISAVTGVRGQIDTGPIALRLVVLAARPAATPGADFVRLAYHPTFTTVVRVGGDIHTTGFAAPKTAPANALTAHAKRVSPARGAACSAMIEIGEHVDALALASHEFGRTFDGRLVSGVDDAARHRRRQDNASRQRSIPATMSTHELSRTSYHRR